MSQEKVDAYKKEKKNRQKIMKKEKWVRRLEIFGTLAVLVVLIGWFSVAVYHNVTANEEASAANVTTELHLDAVDEYNQKLSEAQSAGTVAASSDQSGESVTASSSAQEANMDSVVSAS